MQVIPALYITERLGYVISFCLREKLPMFKNTVYALPKRKSVQLKKFNQRIYCNWYADDLINEQTRLKTSYCVVV